ncbi:MAG: DNA recombination protein RmuC [Calditrichaeota bacterium]|nr:MAG: DNA recombination protein RmuC [Calditrichota bacterium]
MDVLTIVLLVAVLLNIVLTIVVFVLLQKKNNETPLTNHLLELKSDIISKQMDGVHSLRESLDNANKILNDRLSDSNKSIDNRLSVIGDIENKLGQLSRQTSNLETIGKNIQSLSDILKPPKIRGQFGEILLENLLKDILPEQLILIQHRFQDGSRVDAAVKINKSLLTIDSKFPLESFQRLITMKKDEQDVTSEIKEFNRTLKKHIDTIADKYIKPSENTTEFAIMYLPSEALYGELLYQEHEELFSYALSKKVIPSSPGHLYAFLASISALYTEAGIRADSKKFKEFIDSMTETVSKLNSLNERTASSVRQAGQTVDKIRNELSQAVSAIDKLADPGSDDSDENQ